jgi:integrase
MDPALQAQLGRLRLFPEAHRREVEAFLGKKVAEGLKPNGIGDSITCLLSFSRYVAAKDGPEKPLAKSAGRVEGWMAELRREGYKSAPHFFGRVKEFLRAANGGEVPDAIREFRPAKARGNPLHKQLPSPEEVLRLADAARTHADRAAILLTYYGALREHETCALTVGSIAFDPAGGCDVTVPVGTKTGSRTVWLHEPVPDLKIHVNRLSDRRPDAPLFPGLDARLLRGRVKRATVKAGLGMRVTPHVLRAARLTFLAASGVPESDLKVFAGWTPGSTMAQHYIFRSGGEVKKRLQRMAGLAPDGENGKGEEGPKPPRCPDLLCGKENPIGARVCVSCGSPIDIAAARRVKERGARDVELLARVGEAVLGLLEEDPKLKEALKARLGA